MPVEDDQLGGRIELLLPAELSERQRKVYDIVIEKSVPWADKAGFKTRLPDGRLIGPFNTILLSPEMAEAYLNLQFTVEQSSTLSEKVRQVVILTVGAVWKSDYERYAHSAVARQAGLSDAAIAALVAGGFTEDLTGDEDVARRFTLMLTKHHEVKDELFAEARKCFRDRGIAEMVILAGCYDLISSLLNAFKVPAPA